ncbi:MAG: hypothetical protein JXR73_14775, partial [Candidatus Omnitrophica bacterium]|nr:hypothetical protein [Candidatus Omnitrophota bacterium]
EGLDQAISNANGGMNVISIAEGALEETTTRLNRIRELAVQAANTGVNDLTARRSIQDEIAQSVDEITRIANTTQFGNNFLLNGDFSVKTDMISGQQNVGLSIDSSPVASTLESGKAFLNIIKTQESSSQIVSGEEGTGQPLTINTGIKNQSDIAVSMALFTNTVGLNDADSTTTLGTGGFFNSASMIDGDTFVFEGVLADGVTTFTGTMSATGTAADLATEIQTAIDNAEKALFGVNDVADVPDAYHTTVAMGADANAGRITLSSSGNYFNQSDISVSLIRNDTLVTRSSGVTRSGVIGADSGLSGGGQVGNSVTAITGSTFETGQFEITVKDVQAAQQRKVESSIVLSDSNGAVLDRTVTLDGSNAAAGTTAMVLNGTFVGGVYTGGVTLQNGDTLSLKGTNADGTTFEGTYTFSDTATTDLNDFEFGDISGLVEELNFRSRDYTVDAEDGTQTRFEDAIFTFTTNGTLQLIDDVGRSNSQTDFTLTFNSGASAVEDFTIQDKAVLKQEGFAEQATFMIEGGEEMRAEAGEVITLTGPESTKEGVPQSQVTLRVGSGLTAGTDILETTPAEYVGSLNGGDQVTFANGAQDVVFYDGNSGGDKGVARYVTVDFDNIIDVTARTDGLPDAGATLIISTNNSSLNFQIGAYSGQSITASIGDLTAENLGYGKGSGRTVSEIDVTTLEGASDAIKIIDEALAQVDKTRSLLGATTNRLEAAVNNLSVSSENLLASESQIRDVDIATETTEYTSQQVLYQAGISVLAQANYQSQNLLSLLG